jgi:hypothetical protein
MKGHEGDWLDEWVDYFLSRTPLGWPFEEGLKITAEVTTAA